MIRQLRIAVDTGPGVRVGLTDLATGERPQLWRANPATVAVALFAGPALADVGDVVLVELLGRASQTDATALLYSSSDDIAADLTLEQWTAGTGEHVLMHLSEAQTNLTTDARGRRSMWLAIRATYGSGAVQTIECGSLEIVSANDAPGPPPPENPGPAATVDQLLAIIASLPPGSDANYVHQQPIAAATWLIEHNLGKFPAVQAFDSSGEHIIGTVAFTDANNLTLTYSAAVGGQAILN